MSDITQAVEQEAIADSLVAPIEQSTESAPSESESALSSLSSDRSEQFSENSDRVTTERVSQPRESVAEKSETQAERTEQAETVPINDQIQQLDSFVTQNQLNDPESARTFASEFCAALGTDIYAAGINVEKMGHVMAKTAASAFSVYSEMQRTGNSLPNVPPESARAFTYDFLRAFGQDPRSVQVDEMALTQTVLSGALNFIEAYNRSGGKVTDLAQLNDPRAAELFYGQFMKAFGVEGAGTPADRQAALKLADAAGKYLLSFLPKLGQLQQRGNNAQPGGRTGGGRKPRQSFKTNQDIFDKEVLERLDMEKVPDKRGSEFAAKQRRQGLRFQTNRDIFDEETMSNFTRL